MMKVKILPCLLIWALVLGLFSPYALAKTGNGPIVIRDTEIEATLKEWTEPLILAAGLDPGAVKFIIIQSDDVNAFVAGGQNIFLYTGLISKTRNPGELIGVIAHELGHIRGGHLVRLRMAAENASYEAIAGMVLGLGAAILTGNGGAVAAGSMASQSQAMRGYLAFSRAQEGSADQSALYEFNQARMNPTGFLTFMEQLSDSELLPGDQQDEYVRGHPLTRSRIDDIRRGVEQSPYKDISYPAAWLDQHARMKAKLIGFVSPGSVAFTYDDRDQSIPAAYARTIAAYRQNRVDDSLSRIEALLKAEPQNPYFYELKGQMLLDYGRVDSAIPELRRAVSLKGDAPLIRIMYAHALIANSQNGKKKADLDEAISQLTRVKQSESRTPSVQHLLALAYGYKGNEPEAQLHLAEEALLRQNYKEARRLATSAAGQMKKGSRSWLRAQDILAYINVADKSKDNQDSDQNRTDSEP